MTHADLCREKASLVAYLYGECDEADRQRIESHLTVCGACTAELSALGGVRERLGAWTPPETELGFRLVRDDAPRAPRSWLFGVLRPAWALAAAVIVLAAAAAVANLEVRYGPDGLVARTGWTREAAPGDASAGRPWQSDLAALERQLRGEFATSPATWAQPPGGGAARSVNEAELLRRVRALIEESERRQQRELALRVAQLGREVDAQRQADLLRIEQGLGRLAGVTGAEVARQRELMNYLYRVSQR